MLSNQLATIQDLLVDLEAQPSLNRGKDVVKAIVGLIVPGAENLEFRQFTDQSGKLTANAGWFQSDPVITDRLATYILDVPSESNLDIKLYGVNAASMRTIAWSVGLTENFEDEPFNGRFNVGIDFVVPKSLDRVIVALSKNFIVRTIELKGTLTATVQEILHSWSQIADTSRKSELHSILWSSFDLQPINKKFYEGISQRFMLLRQHLEIEKIFEANQASQFANRLIGRVIFTWFLAKKSLLNPAMDYFDSKSFEDDNSYYEEKLRPLFFRVLNVPISERDYPDLITPYLNGGLFEEKPLDSVSTSSNVFPRNFFDDFYGFLKGYNFTTDESTSEFQQVAIDPEMLGRIFENLLAEISDDTGEQARKAKGAFYTPRHVVDFMCRESLKAYLKSRIPPTRDFERRLSQLIDATEREFQDQDHNWRRDLKPYKDDILVALDELRVLDPACGSGAFPMGMLQLLVKVFSRLEPRFDPYRTKLEVLKNTIFGVDIEPMAIEISRLRAWLALVVDEDLDASRVKPLPNLDFKFVCADSLISLDSSSQVPLFDDSELDTKLQKIRLEYFATESSSVKTKLKQKYAQIVGQEQTLFGESRRTSQLKSFRPFDSEAVAQFFDSEQMFGVPEFDIVISNPPYVSNKGRSADAKQALTREFGFADDLYSHFYFRAFGLLANRGVLSFITSKTFWTIQSKLNLRELLLQHQISLLCDSSNPFESAMVDTCIVVSSKCHRESESRFLVPRESYLSFDETTFDQRIFEKSLGKPFFIPSSANLALTERLSPITQALASTWWPYVSSSRASAMHEQMLNDYLETLLPGDFALLGTLADGGVGLQTGNNGRYLGVHEKSRLAEKLVAIRTKKIIGVLQKFNRNELGESEAYITKTLEEMGEDAISELVESLKASHGLDVLGKGFIYRLVSDEEIADVSLLDDDQKINGIETGPTFVPYDKGDKDGNAWYLETPFYINWSRENVSSLKRNVGLKAGGSRYQNSHLYFRDGICWILTLNESSQYLKARFRSAGVFDVNAMTLFLRPGPISDKFLVCLLNSYFIFHLKKHFINGTSAFQINDARQLPIRIPTPSQLEKFEAIFDQAVEIRMLESGGVRTKDEISSMWSSLQLALDDAVLELYGFEPTLFSSRGKELI